MPLVQTRGAASAQGFGEFAQAAASVVYVEDVFSTYLWDGNSTARNIVNGIDLATKGGMVWAKYRNATNSHRLYDTNRGATKQIFSNLTNAEQVAAQSLTAFNTDGFSLGTGQPNETTATVVGWTFRKQAKFFDVVTYTGNGATGAGQSISHNLGSTPGMIIVKTTSGTGNWKVYHRLGNAGSSAGVGNLNTTDDFSSPATSWFPSVTSTTFSVSDDGSGVNNNGNSYVAYLFAHDAGGFGTAGTDNVISCGSYTGNGSATGPVVTLGYEPQYVMIKPATIVQDWFVADIMRGMPVGSGDLVLSPNLSDAETSALNYIDPTATGFNITSAGSSFNGSGETYIYMAIRRPMKVPTTGTSVFGDISASAEPVSTNLTTENGVLADLVVHGLRISGTSFGRHWLSRLTGNNRYLVSSNTNAEGNTSAFWQFDDNNFAYIPPGGYANNSAVNTKYVAYSFKRAPGFFDEVCYTGNGTYGNKNHNLTVAPELIISKARNGTGDWYTWLPSLNTPSNPDTGYLNSTAAFFNYFSGGTIATSTTFVPAEDTASTTYVAYLFATCAGVSKVGSYTGNGGTQAIACGFTGGARFVLIKRTDATGDWYVYDTARGMTVLTDPYLLLNSTAAEVATLGSVTTTTGGFTVDATVLAAINTNAASYIFLAIA
jgi:hypothetical protein